MPFYTVIDASPDQIGALLRKHLLEPSLKNKKPIPSSFIYDNESGIGFVTLHLITGKKVEYQLRGDTPCFVSFTGFGSIRYDIAYPEKENKEMFEILKTQGIEARDNFWKGAQI